MSKQKYTYCPLCSTKLAVTYVNLCAECGHLPHEIEHALAGKHTYAEMRIFGGLNLVLCDFCQVDFGSHHSEFFGWPCKATVEYGQMQFLRDVPEVFIGKDKYCPQCNLRLAFLKFIAAARELHDGAD